MIHIINLMQGWPILHGSKSQATPSAQIDQLAYQIGEDFLRLTTAHFSLLSGAEELVRYLAQKYPLVVLSNGFIEVQYDKINRSGLRDCFAHIVLSEEVGCQKPNPRIYETALQLCGMRAEEVLMIGDSWYSDIRGAINAGIDQLWITNRNTIADNQTATYIVENLQEIYDIV